MLVHNYYQQSGGEDGVVENEKRLLQENGHEVYLSSVSNDSIVGFRKKIQTAINVSYSSEGKKRISEDIDKFRPDIVHVHNFFPVLTPSIYDSAVERGVPVVQTLHNFRTICAGSYLMRSGAPCEICVRNSPFNAVLHRCYRDSFMGSAAVAGMVSYHRRRATWGTRVSRFIALSEFARGKFVEAGFPESRISVKPNFMHGAEENGSQDEGRSGALFVGRLSSEKGVRELVAGWKGLGAPLRVIGDGPLLDEIGREAAGLEGVTLLGRMDSSAVFREMRSALFLIVPSVWYEMFPLTIVEAYSNGLPVLASRRGSLIELVEPGETGLHFDPGDPDDLARTVKWAFSHPDEMLRMGRNAYRLYREKYSPEVNYNQLMDIYRSVLQ